MNLHRLDLNLLVVLDALLTDPSVTHAARRLKVTQPAISTSLKKLREFFNDELFVRMPNGLRPTPYAERLREPVRRAVDIIDIEVVKQRKFDPSASSETFRLSTSDAGEVSFLPRILSALRARAPHSSVVSQSYPPGRLADAMAAGDVDGAIGVFPDLEIPSFFSQKLFGHPIVCLVRRGHPFIGEKITLEQFKSAEQAIVTDVGREQDAFEKLMSAMGVKRRIRVRLAHLDSVPVLVATSDIIAMVPLAVAAPYADLPELRVIQPPVALEPLPVKQYWHRRAHQDPALKWFRSLLGELFCGKDPWQRPDAFRFGKQPVSRGSK